VLQAAVRGDRPDVLRRLLDMGLDPNERMQLGQLEEQTFSAGGPLLEAVNTGRIDLARLLLAHGADPNASVYTAGSATAAAYNGGSPRTHAPDQAMIDLMVQHGGRIAAAAVGYLRNVELARRVLEGDIDPHLESGASSGETVEAILCGGASSRSAEMVRMALERIDWPRDDPRWFWILWRPLPKHRDLNEAEQADSRATFRLILERCDPNLRASESGQTMLHEAIARDHGVGVSLATMLLDAGARTDIRDEFLKSTPLGWACRWLERPIRSSPRPSRGPHRSRGPNGVNMRGLRPSSGNTELTDRTGRAGNCHNPLLVMNAAGGRAFDGHLWFSPTQVSPYAKCTGLPTTEITMSAVDLGRRDRFPLLHKAPGCSPRERLRRQRRIAGAARSHDARAENAEIRHLVGEAPLVHDVRLGVLAHARTAVGMGRGSHGAKRVPHHLDGARRPVPLLHLVLTERRGLPLVLFEIRRDPADRLTERIFHHWIQIQIVVLVGQCGLLHIRAVPAIGIRLDERLPR
jgi:hypothetical protein